MTTMEDIKRTAKAASEESVDAIYDLDEMFEKRNLEWFINRNTDRLYRALEAYSEDEIIEAATDIAGRDPEDYDEAFEIVGREAEDEFAYRMESWWNEKVAELRNEATTPKDGMTRVFRTYAYYHGAGMENEETLYVGTDYNKAREAAIDEYGHLTSREKEDKDVILAYNDYEAIDTEMRDLMEGAESENRVLRGVWHGQA